MTPKEKADELVGKYMLTDLNPQDCTDFDFNLSLSNAKKCALICVDEVLDGNNDFLGRDIYATNIDFSDYENWIMVRDEIKQL
jgi:hypothetical protein